MAPAASPQTSGTPPTRVDTTRRPALAASTIAMQNASVSDALTNTWPRAARAQGVGGWLEPGRSVGRDLGSPGAPMGCASGAVVWGAPHQP